MCTRMRMRKRSALGIGAHWGKKFLCMSNLICALTKYKKVAYVRKLDGTMFSETLLCCKLPSLSVSSALVASTCTACEKYSKRRLNHKTIALIIRRFSYEFVVYVPVAALPQYVYTTTQLMSGRFLLITRIFCCQSNAVHSNTVSITRAALKE